jgi:hypothetical protein
MISIIISTLTTLPSSGMALPTKRQRQQVTVGA